MPMQLDGTLFSIILCILAGIALRYALFYGRDERTDRAQHAQESRRAQQEFQERRQALQDALDAAHRTESALRGELTRSQQELQAAATEQTRRIQADTLVAEEYDRQREELAAEIKALRGQKEELDLQLSQAMLVQHETQRALAETQEQCVVTTRRLETSSHTIAQLIEGQSVVEQLRTTLLQAEQTTDELRQQLRETRSQFAAEQSLRHDLQQQLNDRDQTVAQLTEDVQRAAGLREEQAELQALYGQARQQLASLQEQHAEIERQCAALKDEVTTQQTALDSMQDRLSDAHLERQRMTAELTAALQLESVVDTQEREVTQLTAARDELSQRVEELQSRLPTLTSERDKWQAASQQAQQRIIELEQEVSRSEARANRQDSLFRELRLEREEALTNLERERNERIVLERKLALEANTLEQLHADSRHLEALLQKQSAIQVTLQEHAERLQASGDRQDLVEMPRILSFSPEDSTPIVVDSLVRDPERGMVYNRPPQRRDDLRRISGVGEILETRLNELGVYTFAQILQWQATEVQEFSRLLGFRDRIERDQWVVQAERLHREQTTEAA